VLAIHTRPGPSELEGQDDHEEDHEKLSHPTKSIRGPRWNTKLGNLGTRPIALTQLHRTSYSAQIRCLESLRRGVKCRPWKENPRPPSKINPAMTGIV
jgi:hypothetical protein